MLLHFADLKRDMLVMRRIATFPTSPSTRRADMVEYRSFDRMKRTRRVAARRVLGRRRGNLIHKGVNGRWADTLTREDCAEYEARAEQELGAACARWLASSG
jgi:aryl sulfotransferase